MKGILNSLVLSSRSLNFRSHSSHSFNSLFLSLTVTSTFNDNTRGILNSQARAISRLNFTAPQKCKVFDPTFTIFIIRLDVISSLLLYHQSNKFERNSEFFSSHIEIKFHHSPKLQNLDRLSNA